MSPESAGASVAVDAIGGPSMLQELEEAGGFSSSLSARGRLLLTVEHLPSIPETQEDIRELADAVRNLAQLTIFSSTFRYILGDIFTSTRVILAQGVAVVGEAASEIQIAANKVEPLIDPGNDLSTVLDRQISTAVGEAASDTAQAATSVREEVTDQTKRIIINRVQEVGADLALGVDSILID